MASQAPELDEGEPDPFRILRKLFLNGPNHYWGHSVLVVTTRFARLNDRVLAPPRPGLGDLASIGEFEGGREIAELVGSAKASLPAEAPAAALALEIAARLQQPYVIKSARGRILASQGKEMTALVPADDEDAGLAAWELACRMVLAIQGANDGGAFDLPGLIERRRGFTRLARIRSPDLLTIAVARTATSLDIPVYPYPSKRVIQLGQGKLRRLARETVIEPAGFLAIQLNSDKAMMLARLRRLGVPVLPSFETASEGDAVAAAARIGAAVVVKPVRGGKGRGVSVNLTSDDQVREAFRLAAQHFPQVLVERFTVGSDHRLLVVGGRLIAAAKRIPVQVTGDGARSIARLIEELNADPMRGAPYEKLIERVEVDSRVHQVLAMRSLSLASIPARGEVVALSLAANISQGGTAIDVTDAVHPDNREVVERAAVGLDIGVAGIDFMTPDISRSWREVEGWILEANASPGLRPHWIANPEQDVVTPIVRLSFPEGSQTRIPTAGVTGSIGKTTTCQMVAHVARLAGRTAGLATTQGVWSGGFRVARDDLAGGRGAIQVLTDAANDIGIFEFARGGLLKRGMSIDGVDVAAVLNVHDNHIGLDGITSREDLASIKSLLARNARKWLFLNAEDALVLDMRRHAATVRLGLVSLDPANAAIAAHRRDGHCIVTLEEGNEGATICLVDAHAKILELPLCRIPAGRGGRSRAIAANALFAAGIAHALGLPAGAIGEGLASFTSGVEQNPGRHNWIDGLPFAVLLNWADGAIALGELIASLDQEPRTGARQLFLTCPGNRSDEWIRCLGRTAAGRFDRYCCADMRDLRGRKPGEVQALLAEGLRGGGVATDLIATAEAAERSIITALETMQQEELLVIVSYETEDALQQIAQFKQSAASSLQEG